MKKDRWFSIVTYTDETIVSKVLERYGKNIRAYAYIVHDKDVVDYHIHMMLHTYNPYTYKGIISWFRAVQDDDDERNTFAQSIKDRHQLYQYLTHENVGAEKYKYDEEDIVEYNIQDFFDEETKDDSYECLNDLLNGVPFRTLAKRYGRDFIYHYDSYQKLCTEIKRQEGSYSDTEALSQFQSINLTDFLNSIL